jgi:HNH endonuclease
MPLHPAWVKNISRRVLWAALERDITKADRAAMHAHFGGACAYCGAPLGARWHADHLLPVDQGGYNHISNRVPACARCNEHEKRDMEWTAFLKLKCGSDSALFSERHSRVDEWTRHSRPALLPVTQEQRDAWRREVDALATQIDAAWERLKNAKKV